jgi:hypothetical protein
VVTVGSQAAQHPRAYPRKQHKQHKSLINYPPVGPRKVGIVEGSRPVIISSCRLRLFEPKPINVPLTPANYGQQGAPWPGLTTDRSP